MDTVLTAAEPYLIRSNRSMRLGRQMEAPPDEKYCHQYAESASNHDQLINS